MKYEHDSSFGLHDKVRQWISTSDKVWEPTCGDVMARTFVWWMNYTFPHSSQWSITCHLVQMCGSFMCFFLINNGSIRNNRIISLLVLVTGFVSPALWLFYMKKPKPLSSRTKQQLCPTSLSPSSAGFTHADLDHEQWLACSDKSDWELHCEYRSHSVATTLTLFPSAGVCDNSSPTLFTHQTGPQPTAATGRYSQWVSYPSCSRGKLDLYSKRIWLINRAWVWCGPCVPYSPWRPGGYVSSGGDHGVNS